MIKIIGWIGAILLIGAYTLSVLGYFSPASPWYLFANLIGALCIGVQVYADRNYSNLILQLFWAGIAFVGILKFFIR